jgi:hypothetical protein
LLQLGALLQLVSLKGTAWAASSQGFHGTAHSPFALLPIHDALYAVAGACCALLAHRIGSARRNAGGLEVADPSGLSCLKTAKNVA